MALFRPLSRLANLRVNSASLLLQVKLVSFLVGQKLAISTYLSEML